MPKFNVFLLNEYRNAYVLTAKKNFSEPKIYDANGDLTKRWYVYFSFRNPKTGLLEKQTPIYGNANTFKTKQERYEILNAYRKSLKQALEDGLSPYDDSEKNLGAISEKPVLQNTQTNEENGIAIPDAFAMAVKIKESVLSKTSFPSFNSNIKRFEKWLLARGLASADITAITKKHVIEYLNEVLENTSPRTRNNTRIDLGSLFQTLEDNELIKENFIKKINVLKATPERNKTYTNTLQADIYKYMEENDKILLLFVKFISYNYLRPIEVCRLQVGDLDLVDRKLYVRAKNSPVKTKIIPEILINDLPDLSKMDKKHYLFTPLAIGGEWETAETDKRDYFSKRFKKVKDHFKLGKDYGLYSFRHTFITKLYSEFAKAMTPNEAKSKLMLITGHNTMDALEKYLRDIDAVLPEDYSKFLD
ncbi:site-specific integrase [Flavobacterium sp. 102]|uniref:tyrosine-type recombinase/integrase n=1 Tax=Flavobacterium sp. 102 TaxID=2135623 RepID=UPI000EB238E1|nr:site-specific integrase [Flavobacterium sp. 102]RKS00567.1 phage integrase family protein [Flavobacterium sp. 102]